MKKLFSDNEWNTLKEVIVGTVPSKYLIPCVKKTPFTKSDINLINIASSKVFPKKMLEDAQSDLNNLCDVIIKFGAKVLRTEYKNSNVFFNTPYWYCIGEIVYNARDLNLIVGDRIIDCPSQEKYRFFENYGYYDIFDKYFSSGSKWFAAPKPRINIENIKNVIKKKNSYQVLLENEINFEAANVLRLGKDLLYLVSRSGNRKGAKWLQDILGNKYKVHITEGIYRSSHIDSTIMALRPGLVMLNASRVNTNNCPSIFKKWNKIYFSEIVKTPNEVLQFHKNVRLKYYKLLKKNNIITDINHIASDWIGMNFLSLDKNTVIVDKIQKNLINLLEKMKFNVIPIKFSNSYFLKGGIHCCTLDTVRSE
jgi:N-dimethylarginine dimethylaminohydrolase